MSDDSRIMVFTVAEVVLSLLSVFVVGFLAGMFYGGGVAIRESAAHMIRHREAMK